MRRLGYVLLIPLVVGCSPKGGSGTRPQGVTGNTGIAAQSATGVASVKSDDPWPECAPIRAWLDKNLDDPSGWEVVSWAQRIEVPKAGVVNINMTYRAKNKVGAKQVFHRFFSVKDGKVLRTDDPD